MIFSVSARQDFITMSKADEILLLAQDWNVIYDRTEKYPDKKFVINIDQSNLSKLDELAILSKKFNITLCLSDLRYIKEAKRVDMKYFYFFPAYTFYELKSLLALEVSEVRIADELIFDIATVQEICGPADVLVRVQPTSCFNQARPHLLSDMEKSPFIRPEDINLYDPAIVEFIADSIEQEATLLNIYQKREWPGNLRILIPGLDKSVDNRLVPEEFGLARSRCGMKCMKNRPCHFCISAFATARAVDQYFAENKEPKN